MGFTGTVFRITFLFINVILFQVQGFDVSPVSIGIETTGGIMTIMIPRGVPFPYRQSRLFRTNTDNQTSVLIKAYDGNCAFTKDCQGLGGFELSGIMPVPRWASRIEVTFDIDADGGLHVTAEDKLSEKSKTVTMPNTHFEIDEYNKKAVNNQEDLWKTIRLISG